MNSLPWNKPCLILIIILFVFQTQLSISCNNNEKNPQVINKNNKSFYYEMGKNNQLVFFEKLKSLKKLDSINKVITLLGEPCQDQIVANKHNTSFKYRVLDYYVIRWKKNIVNEQIDRSISLFFDQKNMLIGIISNVEGFEVPIELDETKINLGNGENHH